MREVKRGMKGGKEGGRINAESKEENKGGRKRRCRRETEGSSLGWTWPVLYNTDIQTYTKGVGDTTKQTYLVSLLFGLVPVQVQGQTLK